ncbi:HAD family hydrolase [Natranaerobius trueperi]|uniref:HAD family hydrolase n=1 Tax=Natranaerobius trueperi TaxID=759412 RepID=UPI0013033B86|nr:HAD family hydrolase [Natranaerobius trueperi]
MYRFIAIDVDDTLIDSDLNITSDNKLRIKEVIERGKFITLATGRMFRSALPYAKELEMDLPLITYHGALIKKAKTGEVLYHQPVPIDYTLQIIRLCHDKDLQLNLYIDDELLVKEENELTEYYTKIAEVPCRAVGDLETYIKKYSDIAPTKLTIVANEDMVNRLNVELEQFFGDDLLITQSKSTFLEITHSEANKGNAVSFLAKKHGVSLENTLAIGDSLNDIPMVKKAGLGVAVANARPQLKEVADTIVGSNEESGVAQALTRFVLSESRREMNGTNRN